MYYLYDDYQKNLDLFYKDLEGIDFSNITREEMEDFYIKANDLRFLYNNKHSDYPKCWRYIKVLEKIHTGSRKFGVDCKEKKFLLQILALDPELEAFMIQEEFNRNVEIKTAMRKKFGLYDNKLFLVEKEFIKALGEKEKQEINEKVLKRAFK